MNRLLTLATFLAFAFSAAAVGGNETQGARSMALGGASITLADAFSTTNNVGAIGLVDRYSLAMGFESRYFLPEAGMKSISFVAPVGGGSIGLIGHSYGYAGYMDNRLGLSYGRKLSDYISLGVQMNYVQSRIGDIYGSRSTLVGEVGMMVLPSENIRLGAHVYNPTRSKLADFSNERIPSSLRLGGQYLFSDKVSAMLEAEKDIDYPINLKTGIEYRPAEPIYIRLGYATNQSTLGFGFGVLWKGLRADVGASWNQNLGYSSAVSLSYEFGKRKE